MYAFNVHNGETVVVITTNPTLPASVSVRGPYLVNVIWAWPWSWADEPGDEKVRELEAMVKHVDKVPRIKWDRRGPDWVWGFSGEEGLGFPPHPLTECMSP